MKYAVAILILALSCPAFARVHPEKWYQAMWCDANGGTMEVVMPSGSRCDCLTGANAVEFDFGKKWAESIGQALNYAAQTGRRAGIVLILEGEGDRRHLEQIRLVRDAYGLPLDVWIMDAEGQDSGKPW